MNTKNGFLIVEFTDGLQVIPEKWFNANEQSCIWPTKFKTKFRINKAIVTCEMPQQSSTWEHLPIKRIFGKADTYSNALEKLVNAQDTSHIENSDISSDEMRQERKKRRRVRAKKTLSSSSEYSDKDLCLNDDKENPIKRHKGIVNKLPTFPKLEHFASSSQAINVTNKSLQKPQNVLRDISNANNVIDITDKSMNKTINKNNREELIEEPVINIERENYYGI
ncbi:unnamed protein product [Lasius platythorax]|uniref:Uncharacterized protein n=1 Tax=Lasius platythorax TaxID=488582 RepID=A0AAV2NP67_9HYME